MRARRVRRTGRVNDCEPAVVKQRPEWSETWMQAEEAVEVHGGALRSVPRLGNRNRWTNAVIILFTEWDNDVQSVGGAALEDDDQFLLVRHGRRRHRALQERGNCAHADHGHAA